MSGSSCPWTVKGCIVRYGLKLAMMSIQQAAREPGTVNSQCCLQQWKRHTPSIMLSLPIQCAVSLSRGSTMCSIRHGVAYLEKPLRDD